MPRNAAVYRPSSPPAGGELEVHPAFAAGFAALGIDTAAGFLELPGEVVSGHPDRHVVRVVLPGFPNAFYLKRQHAVTRRERVRNLAAGFGWVSRCEREAAVLKRLAAAGLPAPRWVAGGADGRGRAFLLVEGAAGANDLRRVLSDNTLSRLDRRDLAERLGGLIALVHATGFTTPDLAAKHVLVSPEAVALIDWQNARRVRVVPPADRLRALAVLHASLADELATPRDRLRVLRAALRPAREAGLLPGRFSGLVRRVVAEAARVAGRRSIRDQRQPVVTESSQRLVWVAGEAVCAIPGVANGWPTPAVAPPFYGSEPGTFPLRLPDGREAVLVRGRAFAPVGRLRAWVRGKPWRSPGVTLGRVLFHLERYSIPAPRLLAFGQRITGPASAEWFALHTPPAPPLPEQLDPATAEGLGRLLRALHDAGCRVTATPQAAFGVEDERVCVRDIAAVRIVRRLTDRDRATDLAHLLVALAPELRPAAEAGYQLAACSHARHPERRTATPPRVTDHAVR